MVLLKILRCTGPLHSHAVPKCWTGQGVQGEPGGPRLPLGWAVGPGRRERTELARLLPRSCLRPERGPVGGSVSQSAFTLGEKQHHPRLPGFSADPASQSPGVNVCTCAGEARVVSQAGGVFSAAQPPAEKAGLGCTWSGSLVRACQGAGRGGGASGRGVVRSAGRGRERSLAGPQPRGGAWRGARDGAWRGRGLERRGLAGRGGAPI